jgi:hypothetical protein
MIDMMKQYQTRDGRAVRILCVDGPDHRFPVVGFVAGDWLDTTRWSSDGRIDGFPRPADLIEVVPTITRYNSLSVAVGVSKHEGRVVIGGGSSEPVAPVSKGSTLVGYLKTTQPVGNQDPSKIVFEVIPVTP